MTNSAKPIDPSAPAVDGDRDATSADAVDATSDSTTVAPDDVELPVAVAKSRPAAARRGARFGGYLALALTAIGWMFIAAQNRFELTAPVIVVALGWLAVVQAGFWLARCALETATEPTGGAIAGEDEWFRPTGKVGELQREKQSLLKAIKEVEFDRGLGKMSEADAQALVAMYRAKAIEVIKAIDAATIAAEAAGPRAEIERELRARLQVATAKAKRGSRAADAPAAKRSKGKGGNAKRGESAPGSDDDGDGAVAS